MCRVYADARAALAQRLEELGSVAPAEETRFRLYLARRQVLAGELEELVRLVTSAGLPEAAVGRADGFPP